MSPAESIARSSSPLRVGLIGCGKMGLHHVRAITASGLGTVVAVADPAASLEELGSLLPADAVITASAEEMFQRTKLDVVHIVTPPASHAPMAKLALDAGCHVYIEKPFTPTTAEASEVLAMAAERQLMVCAGHQVLFEAPSLAVWKSLDEIGRVVHIESYFAFKMVRRTITATDQVKDILPHAVYPVVDQIRTATRIHDAPIEVLGTSVDASGELYALLRLGSVTAVVLVTLNGRPVEQYQTIVGTNGSLRPDYIGGGLARLIGPGTGPGVLLTPFRRSLTTLTGTTRGVYRLVRGGSYPGLRTLVARFYTSIRDRTAPPLSPQSIIDTVSICERLGAALDVVESTHEETARTRLQSAEAALPPLAPDAPLVLVTGGTGLLGRRIVEELRHAGFAVRAVARRMPPFSRRVPGVDYVTADLARGLAPLLMDGVRMVVHSAAETAGGKAEHQRNSIDATRRVIEAAAVAGVRQVVHISSLAVIKTSREVNGALDESVPVDPNSLKRGPYVWGKAESELLAVRLGAELNVPVKVIRPGPLVDYTAYHPPGRLGRELGPLFVAMGPRKGALSVCDVSTAARVIRSYLHHFEDAPPLVNLVEAPAPARRELMDRYVADRPDLRVVWFPAVLLRALSGPLKLVQRLALGAKQPIDVAAAFAGEPYHTDLAARVIDRAGPSAINVVRS